MSIRVRIAPSPTGPVHVGTAYTALFNRAFAKHHGGQFILRIEDTDRERSKPIYEKQIMDALKWLGLTWDEGPDIGGQFAPYRQSERTPIYQEYANILISKGYAYKCWCKPERLEKLRKEQLANKQKVGYDKHCLKLSDEEKKAKEKSGEPFVVRLNMPEEGELVWQDSLRGERRIAYKELVDIILLKSDGYPTYQLANVVDDHLMKITHVIRGLEWQDSTPYHWYLYDAFGWDKPEFIHMAWLLGADGKKLSKRRNPVSVDFYRAAGFLPEAMLNFFGLTNYSFPDEREIFSLKEFEDTFQIERMSKGEGAYFDLTKLKYINGVYMRRFAEENYHDYKKQLLKYIEGWIDRLGPLAYERAELWSEFMTQNWFYAAWELPKLENPWENKNLRKVDRNELINALQEYHDALTELAGDEWTLEKLEEKAEIITKKYGWESKKKRGAFFMAVRIAISGKTMTPPLFDTMQAIERYHVISRLERAIEYLRAVSAADNAK